MNTKWTLEDIIDLEYFFQQDDDTNSTKLHERDRNIYLEYAKPGQRQEGHERSLLLATWLNAQRQTHEEELHGNVALEAHALLRLILIFCGILTGASSGLLFFAYSGTTPVNVLHFLLLFIISQLILATLFLCRGSLLAIGLRSLPESITIRLMTTLFTRMATSLGRQGNSHLTAGQRLELKAFYGKIKIANSSYSDLFYWSFFQLIQVSAICFNIGLLAATFFKIVVSDVAFGWQSTLQFSSQSLHTVIGWFSLPWSWLFPEGVGYPSLNQIEGSRIILKEGIAHLQTPDLISWWPFLLLSVLIYGLAIRLVLYAVGWLQLKRTGEQLQFETPGARRVVRRMQTPLVSTQAQPESENIKSSNPEQANQPASKESEPEGSSPVTILLPDEIYDQIDHNTLSTILAAEGFHIEARQRFLIDYQEDQQLLQELTQKNWAASAGILILMEAWMPPLVSFISYIEELREHVGKDLPIILRLIGKPLGTTVLTPVSNRTESQVWRQKVTALGDPYLEIDDLINENYE